MSEEMSPPAPRRRSCPACGGAGVAPMMAPDAAASVIVMTCAACEGRGVTGPAGAAPPPTRLAAR